MVTSLREGSSALALLRSHMTQIPSVRMVVLRFTTTETEGESPLHSSMQNTGCLCQQVISSELTR